MKRLVKSIKSMKSMIGVTLLEIMLVLAIAAMVIVMSVRYYQSASSAQQANAVLTQIQGIVAAADSLAQATGSYAAITTAAVTPLLPGGSLTTPWGEAITIGSPAASSFSIDVGNVPSGVCPLLRSKLTTNNHFAGSATAGAALPTCSTTAATAFTVFYIANP